MLVKEKAKAKKSFKGITHFFNKNTVCEQGHNANRTGRDLENRVESLLVSKGAFPVMYRDWVTDKVVVPNHVKKVLYKQVDYTKLWGTRGKSDFALEMPTKKNIRIDTRYQGVAGSVDEKVCYLLETAEKCYPEDHVIIVIDGPGIRPAIREWMTLKASSVKHKKIEIRNLAQFELWASKNA